MAYRKLVTGDRVKITDGSDMHGLNGTVLAVSLIGVRVEYYNWQGDEYGVRIFMATDLVITSDSPQYKAPIKEEIKMTQFKVGDKVKVVNITGDGFFRKWFGKVGTVLTDDSTCLPLGVKFEDGAVDWGCYNEVELFQPELETPELETLAFKLDSLDKLTAEIRAMVGLSSQ